MNTFKIIRVLLIAVLPFGCNANPKNLIEFEDGQVVDNCYHYNKLREVQFVKDDIDNMIIQSEYLDCSLAEELKDFNDKSTFDTIVDNMTLGDVPNSLNMSLNMSLDKGATFKVAGFESDFQNKVIYLSNDNVNIRFNIKGIFPNGEILVWVVDEQLLGNYRSYFPFKVKLEGNKVIALPFYSSGF